MGQPTTPTSTAAFPRPSLFNSRSLWAIAATAAILGSLYFTGIFQADLFNPGGLSLLGRFFQASLQPDLSPAFLRLTLDAAIVTLAYAICGTFLSLGLGLVGGLLLSEVWWLAVFPHSANHRPIVFGLRAVLAIPRAIHELIWGLFFVNIFGLDPLVAVLAIALPYGAIVAKVFAELLDETPRQPLTILLNSGVNPLTAFLYGLLPQAFLNLLSYSFYRFECSLRSAAVLGVIGAGGLGYQILLSLQSLRYEQLWTLFYALFLLNGTVDLVSALLRRRLGSPSRLDLNWRKGGRSPHPLSPPQRDRWISLVLLLGVILVPLSFWYIDADFSKLWSPRTAALLNDIAAAATPITLDAAHWQLFDLSLQTLAMSILAIAAAGIGGILFSFPAAYNFFLPGGLIHPAKPDSAPSSHLEQGLAWVLFLLSRAILLMARAIPAPIWALVVLFVVFPGILPGAIALAIHNFGILGRLMAEVNENLDQRPLMALKAQGSPASLVFLYGVLPLTLTRFLAYILYRWEVCMRETVIVGLVGAGGLGRLLTEQLSSFDYRSVVVTLSCFVVLTFLVDGVSNRVRRSLR